MKKAGLFVAVMVAFLGATKEGAAEDAFDLATLSCFDVLSLSQDDSLFVTAMLIGHLMAQAGTSQSDAAVIQSAVEGFDTACSETPDDPAIEVMANFL